jgi:hypothetical protein
MELTSESLERVLLELGAYVDELGDRIAARPTHLVVWRGALRQAIFIMHGKHKKHMISLKQRKASKRAKARQHASFIYPRWAI